MATHDADIWLSPYNDRDKVMDAVRRFSSLSLYMLSLLSAADVAILLPNG